MPRPQFTLKTLLWLMTAMCLLAGTAAFVWRLLQPIIHPYPVRTWTVENGEMIEKHTEWSDGAYSADVTRKASPGFATEAEFQSAVRKAIKEQAEKELKETGGRGPRAQK